MPSISITLSSSETGIQTNINKEGVIVSADIISKMYELTKAMSAAMENATDKPESKPGCRIVNKCFWNGQRVRHICKGSIWEGTFMHKVNDLGDIGVIVGDNGYWYTAPDCISQFARDHYFNIAKNYDVTTVKERAWEESECMIDGKWVSTYSLSPLN